MRSLSLLPLLLLVLLLAAPASAHEGLPATLDRLDHRIEDAPNDLDLRLRRAESRRLHHDLPGALEDLKTAAGLAPDDPRVVLERGLVQHELGNTAAARTDLDRYLVLVPERPRIEALAIRATLRSQPANALADLERAISIAPTPDLCADRGELEESMGRLAAAADGYRACASVLSGAIVLRLAAVRVDRERGEFARALADLDSLLTHRPQHPGWLTLRAAILSDLDRPDEARADRQTALASLDRKLAKRNSTELRRQRAALLEALEATP